MFKPVIRYKPVIGLGLECYQMLETLKRGKTLHHGTSFSFFYLSFISAEFVLKNLGYSDTNINDCAFLLQHHRITK